AAVAWTGMILLLAAVPARADRNERLIAALKSPELAQHAAELMAMEGMKDAPPERVAPLADVVLDRNLNIRYDAASVLKGLGPKAAAAVPNLVQCLDTFPGGTPPLDGPMRYYADARSEAAEALGAIGPAAKEALPALK